VCLSAALSLALSLPKRARRSMVWACVLGSVVGDGRFAVNSLDAKLRKKTRETVNSTK
jgi:hypothetical protein